MNVYQKFVSITKAHPHKIAIIQAERSITYAEMLQQAVAIGHKLRSHNLKPGDRCLVSLANSIDTATILLGIFSVGAIPVLLNKHAPRAHYQHALSKTGCSVSVQHEHTTKDLSYCVDVIYSDIVVSKVSSNNGHIDLSNPLPESRAGGETASIVFTSGSSGYPKGVAQSHSSLIRSCASVAKSICITPSDSILCAIPWSFDYGYGQFLLTILHGITQILPGREDAHSICDSIQESRPTVFAGVPSLFAVLLNGPSPIRDTDCSSIRLVTNTGSVIPPTLRDDLFHFFGSSSFSFNYGLTETYRSASLPTNLARSDPESVGFPISGVQLKIIRDDGTEAHPCEEGEITHSGVGTFSGYWGDNELSDKVRRYMSFDGCRLEGQPTVFTGDTGRIDGRGMLYITGRKDRQIKSMGVKVNPEEIEKLMLELDAIDQIAIVSKPNNIIGDKIVAVVVPTPGYSNPISEIKSQTSLILGQYMQPRQYIIEDKLPRTTTGKINYSALSSTYLI